MSHRIAAAIAAAATLGAVTASCDLAAHNAPHRPNDTAVNGPGSRAILLRLLDRVDVVDHRQEEAGYEEDQSFGPDWTDEHNGAGGGNDCDTRDDVLAAQLTQVTTEDGCVVLTGTLHDPYTGRTIAFSKEKNPYAVQIDHVYPRKYAWDMGAADWTEAQRIDFANDQTLNLIAADGPTNASKGDDGPGAWMPPNEAFHCVYAIRFLRVAITYQLPLTVRDATALRAAADTCAGRGRGRPRE
jgi:hypothetical protein